jgi:hypothetical protein
VVLSFIAVKIAAVFAETNCAYQSSVNKNACFTGCAANTIYHKQIPVEA